MAGKSYTLAELAKLTTSKLVGDAHASITNVADLENASEGDASFFKKMDYGQVDRYEQLLRKTRAGVVFVPPETQLESGRNYLLNEDPSRAFQQVLEAINGKQELSGFTGVHSTAVVHPTAKIGKQVTIGPHAVIDQGVILGDRTFVGAGTYIGPGTVVGQDCVLHPRVTIRERCTLGNHVSVQPGAVIGSCGFGYTTDKTGRHTKLNQVGGVLIEDDVEIGANTTIDRSRFKETVIGRGSKIDNLVQIGHGVKLGQDNMIVSQTGIAGSTETGRCVVMAGQCGISGHIKLSDGVILSARSGVDKSLPAGKYGGAPVMPMGEYNRVSVFTRNIEKYVKQLKALENRLNKLEGNHDSGLKP